MPWWSDRIARRRARAVVLAVMLLATVARGARWRPVVHLADELAAAGGLREPPAVTVESSTRYALAVQPAASVLGPGSRTSQLVDVRGRIEVSLGCPAAWAGRRILVRVEVPWGVRDGKRVEVRASRLVPVLCPAAGSPAPTVEVSELPAGLEVDVRATGYLPPASRVESPWLRLPPGARLRFAAAASAGPLDASRQPATRFRVTAAGKGGHDRVLFDRVLDPARAATDRGWIPLVIALDDASRELGARIRLVFETEAVGGAEEMRFPAWGDPTIVAPEPSGAPLRRNVVLVSIDTLRADRLGCYGAGSISPHLDRLAADGTLFERTISQANWTRPAHASMLTGLAPCAHRVGFALGRMAPAVTPLAEILRRAGYATAAFTEDVYVDAPTFQRGFGSFFADAEVDAELRPVGTVAKTLQRGLAWIDRHGDEPFFLFLHTYQVHAPYTPPAGYRSWGRGEPAADPRIPQAHAAEAAAYAGEVHYTDAEMGRFLDALDARGLREGTIVVVTADHGEAFGEHGAVRHGETLYEEEVRVPLLWRAPGLVASGRRVGLPVGLVDVVPTLLDLLDLQAPAAIDGRSLRPLLGEPMSDAGALYGRIFPIVSRTGGEAFDAGAWKAIYPKGRGSPMLFLLGPDPYERMPIRSVQAMVPIEAVRKAQQAECRRTLAAMRATATASQQALPAPAPDVEQERKLRALGYVE